MKSQDVINIAVAETSMIVRTGLISVLKHLPDLNIQTLEVSSIDGLHLCMESHKPDILIINPMFDGWINLEELKQKYEAHETKFISLICSVVDSNVLKGYDDSINLFDNIESLSSKISLMMNFEEDDEDTDSLSQREKEILGCVVRGMTNKEIAEKLYISVHTVITHRRNLTRKLQIHSAAGLTIYAIVNKLVDISEVKMKL
ncbi:response regulator transcription factor [Bacteroides caecigallinarum]|uniref:response regulator transcription factor n=1 Tax=Bacteroides caecigallinarum TaxID=1411144 RepID=UPI00195B02D6|nr:response regulator transcription factor [Bacteroides caecigallinarum]MBM6882848.1 response regulator transcription factor [Bacteroides caecigallinarum]